METLIPEVIPKKYENLSLEEITDQGAYIRVLTLIILEGMVSNTITSINCITKEELGSNMVIHYTLTSLEACMVRLL